VTDCAYNKRIQAVEMAWRNEFGDVSITLLRGILEEVAEPASQIKGPAR
jgi:hypothetical protein